MPSPLSQSAISTPATVNDAPKSGADQTSSLPEPAHSTPEAPPIKTDYIPAPIAEIKAVEIPLSKKEFQAYFTTKESDLYSDYFNDASVRSSALLTSSRRR